MNYLENIDTKEETHFKDKSKRNIRADILNLIKKHKYGLNVSQIAEKLNLSRNTVKKYLATLEQERLILVKQAGQSKLILLVNKSVSEVLLRVQSFISDYLTSFWKAYESVMYPINPKSHELLVQMGREMSRNLDWPVLTSTKLVEKTESKKKLLEEIGKYALQLFEMFNNFGQVPLLLPELVPAPKSIDSNVLIMRVEFTGGFNVGNTEAFYYLHAGFFEENLHQFSQKNVYVKVLDVQKEKSCCYYEIGLFDE
ncbi:MAG: winged helix-turn-helix domain-containing protein [Candidatus Helarchaeota archaeon]